VIDPALGYSADISAAAVFADSSNRRSFAAAASAA
jgi:hypothetical protein